ncbi:MAG: redoxin domain-containing protein [Verrucomicrobiales bacterium]|nr:redoxin domain-containing protein [Verrucomicrobiales bacterium]
MQKWVGNIAITTLLVTFSTSHAETKKPLPAWSSSLQCLAPLAREAREGNAPLKLDQAFFDGPYRFDRQLRNASEKAITREGFERLLAFDDREAELAFREAVVRAGDTTSAWIGLAAANTSSLRRFACFADAATASTPTAEESMWIRNLRAAVLESDEEALNEWLSLAISSDDFAIAVSLACHLIRRASMNIPDDRTSEIMQALTEAFPEIARVPFLNETGDLPVRQDMSPTSEKYPSAWWSRLSAEQALNAGQLNNAAGFLRRSIDHEWNRLEQTGQIMPEASLNLGETSARLLQLLLSGNETDEASSFAKALMKLPRDANAVGKKWSRLQREATTWVVARQTLAQIALREKDWEGVAALPKGFTSRDKAEWFFWQVMAKVNAKQDFNLWLAALRREAEGSDLVSAAESYLHWQTEGEWLAEGSFPGIPPFWLAESTAPSLSPGPTVSTENLIMPLKLPAAPFTLENGENEMVSLDQFIGEPLVVIFFLGGGCLHCVEQLNAFGPKAESFAEAGIKMLAISTDPVSVLTQAVAASPDENTPFPIPIVSNEDLDVFQSWGAYDDFDGRAIHGTFLLDRKGEIIWMETGNTPYMHGDYLLYEATRLLTHP